MTTIRKSDIRKARITISELADLCQIPSTRLYRAASGCPNLTPAEFERVSRVLAAARARGELQPVA